MTERTESARSETPSTPPRRAAGESLRPEERLTRRLDYQRVYRQGRRRGGRYLVLHWVPNDIGHPRLGMTASRKVGRAVRRQRVRRRVREIYRRWSKRSRLPACDYVVHLKPGAAEADFHDLRAEMLRLLSSTLGEGGRR